MLLKLIGTYTYNLSFEENHMDLTRFSVKIRTLIMTTLEPTSINESEQTPFIIAAQGPIVN